MKRMLLVLLIISLIGNGIAYTKIGVTQNPDIASAAVIVSDAKASSQNTLTSNSDKDNLFSYHEYQEICLQIKKKVSVPDYEVIFSSDNFDIMLIGGEYPFSKRNSVSLPDNDMSPTQNRIVYLSKNGKIMMNIDLVYTSVNMGEELVFFMHSSEDEAIESELKKPNSYMIFTYKNLILTVHQTNSAVADHGITRKFAEEMEIFLKNIKFDN